MNNSYPDYRKQRDYLTFVPAVKALLQSAPCPYHLNNGDFIRGLESFIIGAEEIAFQGCDGSYSHPARDYIHERQTIGWSLLDKLDYSAYSPDDAIDLLEFIINTLHMVHFYTIRMPILAYYVNRRPALFDLVKYYFGSSPQIVASLVH